jgi:hypothetical protein
MYIHSNNNLHSFCRPDGSPELTGALYVDHIVNKVGTQLPYRPIFGRLINQTESDKCDIYLVSNLHIFYYQKRKGLDWSIANESVSDVSIS